MSVLHAPNYRDYKSNISPDTGDTGATLLISRVPAFISVLGRHAQYQCPVSDTQLSSEGYMQTTVRKGQHQCCK